MAKALERANAAFGMVYTRDGSMRMAMADSILRLVPWLTIVGFAGLAATCLLGFEEPNHALLAAAALALLAAPVAVIGHLGLTRDLTPAEKHTWLGALHGRQAMWAWSAYLTSSNRAAVARDLAQGATDSRVK